MSDSNLSSLGIDVGATNIKYICLTHDGEIQAEGSVLTERGSYNGLLDQLKNIYFKINKDAGNICGAGIVIPGFIDFGERRIFSSPNLKILDGKPIWEDVGKILGTDKFVIDNDANGAAYGEYGFRKRNELSLEHLVFLTLGSGVGGGVIVGGSLLHGSRGYGAELGHIKLYDDGRLCGCGAAGCAEAYIGNKGIVDTFRELAGKDWEKDSDAPDDLSAKKIAELADTGSMPAVETMKLTGKRLGLLISILINIFNPQIIAVGGGIIKASDLLLPPALEEARKKTIKCAFDSARIEKALLGSEAGAFGAAALARDRFE